jgi:hypothetical protein
MVKNSWAFGATFFLVMGMSGMAFGNPPNNGPGCGLGKLAWENSNQKDSIGGQVLMATTNGTGFQTFAISSGTSGCTNDGQILASEKVNVFAAVNFDNLSQEMAQGQGEHLTSLATLMGIPVAQQPAFFAMTQEKYTTLIQVEETSPKTVVNAIHGAMVNHPVFAQTTSSK